MVIHKIKERRKKNEFQLINYDGSWNILCGRKGSHIEGSNIWSDVSCMRCLKLRGEQK